MKFIQINLHNKLLKQRESLLPVYVGLILNIFVWYDFLVFAYFADLIGQIFFNTSSHTIAIFYSFIVFTISYVIRPIGSIMWGYLADKLLSPVVMLQCMVIMMAIPTILIGFIPSYHQIGSLASVSLVCIRLIQGFAAGGELIATASYIYNKHAKSHNKILLMSLPSVGSMLGSLLASSLSFVLFTFIKHDILIKWGYKIPFLLGVPLLLVMLYIIKIVKHNTVHSNANTATNVLRKPIANYSNHSTQKTNKHQSNNRSFLRRAQPFVIALQLASFLQVSFYLLFVWLPTYLTTTTTITRVNASFMNMVSLIIAISSTLFFAYLARRIHYVALLQIGIIGILLFITPIFTFNCLSHAEIFIYQSLLGIFIGCIDAVFFYTIAEIFPPSVRNRGMGITFTFASSYCGGTAPLLASYFVGIKHYNQFPVIYILFLGSAAFIVNNHFYCRTYNRQL